MSNLTVFKHLLLQLQTLMQVETGQPFLCSGREVSRKNLLDF